MEGHRAHAGLSAGADDALRARGDVPNVVFPSAMVTFPETNTMRIYYGCADTCVSMAEADIGEVIAFIREHSL